MNKQIYIKAEASHPYKHVFEKDEEDDMFIGPEQEYLDDIFIGPEQEYLDDGHLEEDNKGDYINHNKLKTPERKSENVIPRGNTISLGAPRKINTIIFDIELIKRELKKLKFDIEEGDEDFETRMKGLEKTFERNLKKIDLKLETIKI